MQSIFQPVLNSFTTLLNKTIGFLPNLISAIVLLVIGWMVAKALAFAISKFLEKVGFQKVMDKAGITSVLDKGGVSIKGSQIFGKLFYWIIFLLFLNSALDSLQLTSVTMAINELFNFIPRIIAGLLILVFGLYLGKIISDAVRKASDAAGLAFSGLLASAAYMIATVFMVLIAISQIGINVAPIFDNITLLIAGFVGILILALGLGGKSIASNLLSSYYARKNFKVGDHVTVGGVSGEIVAIDNIYIKVKSGDTTKNIPAETFSNSTVDSK